MKLPREKIIKLIKQLMSYFVTGGIAALVEWGVFWVLDYPLSLGWLLSTVLSFLAGAFTNLTVGRLTTFKNEAKERSYVRDILPVMSVCIVGLLFNTLLMFIFSRLDIVPDIVAKIISTGIVFLWNFAGRKIFVYKEKKD